MYATIDSQCSGASRASPWFGHDLRKPPIGRRGVAKRVVQHREGHLDGRSEPPMRRSLSDQLDLRPECPCGLDVAAQDMEMQARGKDVLVVRALTGLQEAGKRFARDPLGRVEVTSIDLDLGQHGKEPRDAGPVAARPGVLDQSLDPAAPLGRVAVVAEDPAELQVGVLEERHVVQRQGEDVCALQEVPPRSAEGAQPCCACGPAPGALGRGRRAPAPGAAPGTCRDGRGASHATTGSRSPQGRNGSRSGAADRQRPSAWPGGTGHPRHQGPRTSRQRSPAGRALDRGANPATALWRRARGSRRRAPRRRR